MPCPLSCARQANAIRRRLPAPFVWATTSKSLKSMGSSPFHSSVKQSTAAARAERFQGNNLRVFPSIFATNTLSANHDGNRNLFSVDHVWNY